MSRLARIEQLLAGAPDDLFLNFGLAMELAKDGQAERALAQFDRVLELDASYVAAHMQKAKTLIAVGQRERARKALEIGIEAAENARDSHAESEMRGLLEAAGS